MYVLCTYVNSDEEGSLPTMKDVMSAVPSEASMRSLRNIHVNTNVSLIRKLQIIAAVKQLMVLQCFLFVNSNFGDHYNTVLQSVVYNSISIP